MLLLIVFSVRLHWLPSSARAEYGLRGLVLPVVCLLIVTASATSARMVRASVVATLELPYVRTARLKGITTSDRSCAATCCATRSIVPVSALGVQLRYLVGGLITVELLFNYAGVGSLLLEAAQEKDVPTLQAATLVTGVIIILTFVLTDLVAAWLDPRVRLGARA